MAEIDVHKACKEFLDNIPRLREQSKRNANIILSHLKIEIVSSIVWKDNESDTLAGPLRQCTLESLGENVAARLEAATNLDYSAVVNIHHGRVLGLNKRLKMPTPRAVQEVIPTILVDPSKHESRESDQLKVNTNSSRNLASGTNAHAELQKQRVEYVGSFQCTVGLSGNVIFHLGPGDDTFKDVRDINIPGTVKNDRFRTWSMQGTANFTCGTVCNITFMK